MLPSRVSVPAPPNPEQEDIFSASLSALFTDDTQNSHGTPGQSVVYQSPRFGSVTLEVPRHPDAEEGRQLFAHYLWNAGVVAADAIEYASNDDGVEERSAGQMKWNRKYWNMRRKDVLELGAGTALPSIIAAFSGARSVVITDHPSSPALVTDTIVHNVLINLRSDTLPKHLPSSQEPDTSPSTPLTTTKLSVHGLVWGDPLFTNPHAYGTISSPQPEKQSFDKLIVADCLWMPNQHVNLVKTIGTYLRPAASEETQQTQEQEGDEKDTDVPCALVIAGFHTGRGTVARFIEIATGSRHAPLSDKQAEHIETCVEEEEQDEALKEVRGTLSAVEIFEVDVDCNVRSWTPERAGEDREQLKKWCVCAVLVRR